MPVERPSDRSSPVPSAEIQLSNDDRMLLREYVNTLTPSKQELEHSKSRLELALDGLAARAPSPQVERVEGSRLTRWWLQITWGGVALAGLAALLLVVGPPKNDSASELGSEVQLKGSSEPPSLEFWCGQQVLDREGGQCSVGIPITARLKSASAVGYHVTVVICSADTTCGASNSLELASIVDALPVSGNARVGTFDGFVLLTATPLLAEAAIAEARKLLPGGRAELSPGVQSVPLFWKTE